jgi:glycosyltransferase involved in cell wall biosynthesis
MKIAFVAQPFDLVLPPHQSSIGLIVYNTARLLADRADVTVYHPTQRPAEQAFVDDRGVTFRAIDTRLDLRLGKVLRHIPLLIDHSRYFDYSAYFYNYIRRIALDARTHRFDIAHILDFSQFALAFKRHNTTTKIVLEMQCEWLAQLERSTVIHRLEHVDLVTGCSNHITDGVKRAIGDIGVPCRTAYNGIDPDRFRNDEEGNSSPCAISRVILFVGRVSPEKGVHDLIEAMPEVVRHDPQARLRIVGPTASLPLEFIVGLSDDPTLRKLARFYDGSVTTDYQAYLERRIVDLNLTEHVEFKGAVPQFELADLYRASRVLVNPSYSESFGMTVTEGMAVGLPVVVTAVGGMKELVEVNKTGFLVEQDHPEQIAKALLTLLQDDQLCRTMGTRGMERVREHFSWQKRADNLWSYYGELVQ